MTKNEAVLIDFKVMKASDYFGHKWLKGGLIHCTYLDGHEGFLTIHGKAVNISIVDCKRWVRMLRDFSFANPQFLGVVDKPEIGNLFRYK